MRSLIGIALISKCFIPHCDIVLGFLTFLTSSTSNQSWKKISAKVNNINAEQQLTKSRCSYEKPCTLLMTTLKERYGMWKITGIMYGVTGENFILISEQALKILRLWQGFLRNIKTNFWHFCLTLIRAFLRRCNNIMKNLTKGYIFNFYKKTSLKW